MLHCKTYNENIHFRLSWLIQNHIAVTSLTVDIIPEYIYIYVYYTYVFIYIYLYIYIYIYMCVCVCEGKVVSTDKRPFI